MPDNAVDAGINDFGRALTPQGYDRDDQKHNACSQKYESNTDQHFDGRRYDIDEDGIDNKCDRNDRHYDVISYFLLHVTPSSITLSQY